MKRKMVVIVSGLILIGVLAVGAYTAVHLLAKPEPETAVAPGARVLQSVVDAGSGPLAVRTVFIPAPELPAEPAAAGGIVVRRQDNSLVVGTGNVDVMVEVEIDGNTGQERRSVAPRTDGPEVEVVLNSGTIIYRDLTDFSADMPSESGERQLQQVVRQVETGNDIQPQMEIQVWGRQRGNRIIADVVVFGPLPGF